MNILIAAPLLVSLSSQPKLDQSIHYAPIKRVNEIHQQIEQAKIEAAKPKYNPLPLLSTVTTQKARESTVKSVRGNTYQAGQCVWHVKNLKPDLPNGLGSAYQWLGRARSMGLTVSSVPKAGAAGVRGNHAVYVVRVNADGSVLISEMNYNWVPFSQRTITRPGNYYTYIY